MQLPAFYKQQANWLTSYCHGLTFDCGDMHINDFLQATYPKLIDKTVYVKGHEKGEVGKRTFSKLSPFDNKRHILSDNIRTLPWGHYEVNM